MTDTELDQLARQHAVPGHATMINHRSFARAVLAAAIPSIEGCALGNRDLPNFDPADLTIDSFPRRPPGGMQVGMSVGVLVRHKPSGFSVIVDNHRSQHRNRDEALRQLAFLVHVFGDMPAATSHPTPKE